MEARCDMRRHDFTLSVAAVQSCQRSLTGVEAGGRLIDAQLDLRKCVRNFAFFATIDHGVVPCWASCVNSIDCDRPRMSWSPFKVEFTARSPWHRIGEIKQSKILLNRRWTQESVCCPPLLSPPLCSSLNLRTDLRYLGVKSLSCSSVHLSRSPGKK